MAKRKLEWTEKKIAKYIKEGRGSGELKSYKPWLTVQDVPSDGRSHRINGWKTNRIHHLLSDLERDYFYLLNWAKDVIDIREQFPLDREKTYEIASERNINHPIDSKTGTPIVLTTDFLITKRINGRIQYFARTIKPSELLNHPRTIEKFEIERAYWQEKDIDWGIVTEREIPMQYVKNIIWLYNAFNLENDDERYFADILYHTIANEEKAKKLSEIVSKFEADYNLDKGAAIHLLRYLFAQKMIRFNMEQKFSRQLCVEQLIISKGSEETVYDFVVS
ncbi:TnsA endonuclease N-terminal domain-containing protein [Rossellomorea oryzaecorticis]|uniref:TnsA endonuclease N-terminal domain-containing protein n=1 Tax=Rossellomorea oryzaecorticis TaxID=1396505 RepID=A0ABW8VUU0_9BACI